MPKQRTAAFRWTREEVARVDVTKTELAYLAKCGGYAGLPKQLKRDPSEEEMDVVRNDFRDYLRCTSRDDAHYQQCAEALEKVWPQVREKLKRNRALMEFMQEFGGRSEFFVPFLLNIPKAITLDAARGYGVDILGEMRKIPETDPFYAFSEKDEMFAWIRKRMAGEKVELVRGRKVLFVGGGLTQVLRCNNYPLEQLKQEIVVCDLDKDLREMLKLVFPKPVEEMGMKYYFEDAAQFLRRPEYQQHFDVLDASGFLSYRRSNDELYERLRDMTNVTRPGGSIIFDFQVLTSTLLFDKFLLYWETDPPMMPEIGTRKPIRRTKKMCEDLMAQTGRKITCEVVNEAKIGVQFVLRVQ